MESSNDNDHLLPAEPAAEPGSMPVWQHLEELRVVLVRSLLALSVGFLVAYSFNEKIIRFLEAPILSSLPPGEKHLYFTGLTDKFMVYLKMSFYSSLVICSPYLLKQVWNFISPALREKERRFAGSFLVMGTLSFWLGILFAYYIVIPAGYNFLLNFGGPTEKPLINISEYFSLTLQLLISMGLLFELPVVLVLLGKIGVMKSEWLTKFRPQAYLALAVLAGFLTPTPDAFTMLLVLVPLILLYEVSVQLVRWVMKSPQEDSTSL